MSVVFTDAFTVSSDTAITSYPSAGSPDYAQMDGSGSMTVNAANDRVQYGTTSDDAASVCTDTACPTGDYEVTATCYRGSAAYAFSGIALRGTTGSGGNYYEFTIADDSSVELYRIDNGSFTFLQSFTRTTAASTQYTCVGKVTGTTTVALEYTIGATTVMTYNDTNASRKTSGRWGIAMYQLTANQVYFDDASVDDLISGEGVGSSAGTSTASAVGASTRAASGSSAGVATASATGQSTRAAAGTSAGVATATAVGASTAEAAGSTAGVGAASGVGASTVEAVGSSAGVGAASGVGTTIVESVGSSAGVATATAVGDTAGTINSGAGSSAGVATASAVGASTAAGAGSSPGVGAAAGVGASTAAVVGTAAGVATAPGVAEAVGVEEGVGTAAGTSNVIAIGTWSGYRKEVPATAPSFVEEDEVSGVWTPESGKTGTWS